MQPAGAYIMRPGRSEKTKGVGFITTCILIVLPSGCESGRKLSFFEGGIY